MKNKEDFLTIVFSFKIQQILSSFENIFDLLNLFVRYIKIPSVQEDKGNIRIFMYAKVGEIFLTYANLLEISEKKSCASNLYDHNCSFSNKYL